MTSPFNPQQGFVEVEADLTGPSATLRVLLGLDTGATRTLVDTAILVALGFNPNAARQRTPITTASGTAVVLLFNLPKITALGQDRTNFSVLCHTMPSGIKVYGLLGLDFFRGHILTLDFQNGQISLT